MSQFEWVSELNPIAIRQLQDAVQAEVTYHNDRGDQIASDRGDPGPSYNLAHEWERHRDTLAQLIEEWEAVYDPA